VSADPSHPQISVVVPVWDRYAGTFLDEALASVTSQRPQPEVIVVDNASVEEVSVEDERVRVIRTPRRLSCGEARNFGLRHVRAPLVVVWDADDVMLPGTLESLVDAMAADPRLVAHATAILDHASRRRHRWPRQWIASLTRRPRLLALINSIWSQYPTTGATVMKTGVVREAGGYGSTDGAEDWFLSVALLWRGRVGWSERPGRLYRRHDVSISRRHRTTQHLLAHAHGVRALLRRDPAVPRWCRAGLPVIELGQYFAILAVRPAAFLFRRLRAGRGVAERAPEPLLES
jgi:glycosyltransferase involved in cell wall biosynthesis